MANSSHHKLNLVEANLNLFMQDLNFASNYKLFKKQNFSHHLRLYQAYGPGQDINRFIPIVIDACLKNKI